MQETIKDDITKIDTFGDARHLLLNSLVAIKNKEMPVSDALAMAKVVEAVNHNIQCEINYAKIALLAESKGRDFGRVVQMGKTIINGG